MKKTIKITFNNEKEYDEYKVLLEEKGFTQIGTRLFEDNRSYVSISINK
jgi:hypothetical protein